MDTQPVATPTAPAPPVAEPAPVEPPDSIASHAEQFNPPTLTIAKEQDERPRHRAKSQQATAADVPRINELTRKLREAEAELARYRSAPRVEPPSPPSVKPPAPPAPVATAAAPPAGEGFTDPEPKLEDFSDKDDPYLHYNRAWAKWDRKKDAFEEQQAAQAKATEAAASREAAEAHAALEAAHRTRLTAFRERYPDFDEKLTAASKEDANLPPVLYQAILRDDNGPEILYHLLTHPVELDDMRLRALALPPTLESVALLRRRLRPYAQLAAPTGSAASVPSPVLAPRPPNPVRTGPMHTDTEPSGEQGSIAAHAKAFDPHRRR